MKKIISYIPIMIIILFLGLFFSYQNGYYDKYMKDKIDLTNQSIEQFEQDIKDGKDVLLEDYLQKETSYATKTSTASLKVSNKLEKIINNGIKYIFRKISSVVE
ncbi:MAG: hypothetical protein IJ068_02385 [Bacilli bacterium]|nr:hypothetical protein [Bacilli bacterium]